MNKKKSKKHHENFLTPEQIILWLEGHRELMMEIWKNNPGSRQVWEQLNEVNYLKTKKSKS